MILKTEISDSGSQIATLIDAACWSLRAFAQSWGQKRKELLERAIGDHLVIPISDPRIHQRWGELYSFARANGLAIQQDHNDIWIAARAHVAGLQLLSTDGSAFLPLRGSAWLDVIVLDPRSGKNAR